MEPIAVVYWIENGEEKMRKCFDQITLERTTRYIRRKGWVSWTCMCGGSYIPLRRTKSHLTAI